MNLLIYICFSFTVEVGHYLHPCENDLVVKCTNDSVPYFNAPIYLENKSQIGKVDEIFGPMTDFISFHFPSLIIICDDNLVSLAETYNDENIENMYRYKM